MILLPKTGNRVLGQEGGGDPICGSSLPPAFTLIEIMIVVAIVGLILATGIPSIARAMRPQGMSKAVGDLVEACQKARGQAILGEKGVDLVFHPLDGSFEVPGAFETARLPDNVSIDILGVNFIQYELSDEARIHFFPNGTSDEFTIVLRSDKLECRKISLDILTSLPDVEIIR